MALMMFIYAGVLFVSRESLFRQMVSITDPDDFSSSAARAKDVLRSTDIQCCFCSVSLDQPQLMISRVRNYKKRRWNPKTVYL